MIDLKRIYCSYSRRQNSKVFFIISVIIFKVNIFTGHVNAKRMTIIDISSSFPFNWLDYCNDSLFAGMIHTAQDSGSLFWCHTVVSLQVARLSAEASCETCERIVLLLVLQVFLRCFRDPNRVPGIENRVPRIRKNYHRVPRIRENRVPRIREIGSVHVHTGYPIFSLKKSWIV